jgi:serine/threonine-protein kinase
MGLVYEAQHLLLQKAVAVKVLRPEMAAVDDVRERFQAEARAAAAIGHPNIISVTDMGRTPAGALYFVMDRLRGETLGERLERVGRIDAASTVAIVTELLSGLAAAHELGLIHRDLKPDNIFFAQLPGGRETPRILDFGVAKALSSVGKRAQGTRAGFTVGTPQYMAPEQAAGAADVDVRVDVYAMGVVMYHMLAGRVPFDGDDVMQVLTAVVQGKAPPLGELCPETPKELVRLVESAMSRDRKLRPASAAEFAGRLAATLGNSGGRPLGLVAPSVPDTVVDIKAFGALDAPVLMDMGGKAGKSIQTKDARSSFAPPPSDFSDAVLELDRPDAMAAKAADAAASDPAEADTAADPMADAAAEAGAGSPAITSPEKGSEAAPPGRRRRLVFVLGAPVLALAALLVMNLAGDKKDVSEVVAALPGERMIVQFDVVPPASNLLLDGKPTTNPAQLLRGSVHRLTATFNGYEPQEVEFTTDGSPVKVELRQQTGRPKR